MELREQEDQVMLFEEVQLDNNEFMQEGMTPAGGPGVACGIGCIGAACGVLCLQVVILTQK